MIASARDCEPARRAERLAALQDALFLVGITVLSLVSYVGRLGFYLDDYLFLRILGRSRSQSFLGLYDHLHAEATKARLRPVQIGMLAGLYRLFGDDPHPYHLFNAAVLVAGVVLIYLLLRELGQSRLVSVAVAVLYATLPHFSTDRFWVAAFQANVSMTLYFASQYAALRALRAKGGRWVAWGAGVVVAAVGSVLAYEVALPLFLLTPFLVVYQTRRVPAPGTIRRTRLLLASGLIALAAALAAKLVVAVQVGHESSYRLGVSGGPLHHLAYLVRGAITLNFGSYGVALPYVTGWVIVNQLDWVVALLTVITVAAVFAYLRHLVRMGSAELPSAALSKRLLVIGIVVVALGYAVFVTNSEIFFTSAGVDNRVNIAAAFGMAIVLVALLGWAAARLPPSVRGRAFVAGVSAVCAAGFLIVNALGSFWVEAARKQGAVMAALDAQLPVHAGQGTVLLDGVCPEIGPAIVFTTQYDLTGALYLLTGDPGLGGAVLTPHVDPRPKALWIANFFNGNETSRRSYPYGSTTYVYDYAQNSIHRLPAAAAARHYLRALSSHPHCPAIRSFDWGIPARYRRLLP